jgi:sterol desaturase/sphingolipid hydroxylase (fatty acid hydroxylase superfamily)
MGLLIGAVMAFGMFEVQVFHDLTIAQKIGVIFGGGFTGSVVLGPFMKYIFNSPEMHIWHHAYSFPADRKYGMNYGLSLSIWDWVFGTAYIPKDGRDLKLGFPGVEQFPKKFLEQEFHGFGKKK